MKDAVARSHRPEVLGGLGGFAGFFDASALASYRHPVLATSTDGVGTKVAIAAAMDVLRHHRVRPDRHARRRPRRDRRRAAVRHRLHRVRQVIPSASQPSSAASQRRARPPGPPCSAGRRPSTPACWTQRSSTSPARPPGWWSSTRSSAPTGCAPATSCWPSPRPGCTRMAIRWSARCSGRRGLVPGEGTSPSSADSRRDPADAHQGVREGHACDHRRVRGALDQPHHRRRSREQPRPRAAGRGRRSTSTVAVASAAIFALVQRVGSSLSPTSRPP